MATLSRGLRLSEMHLMSDAEKERQTARIFEDALNPTPDQINTMIERVNAEIRMYERQYEKPSAVMLQELSEGHQKETLDICNWLMCLKIRESFYQNKCL